MSVQVPDDHTGRGGTVRGPGSGRRGAGGPKAALVPHGIRTAQPVPGTTPGDRGASRTSPSIARSRASPTTAGGFLIPARYFEDYAPGRGRAASRAALDSDAPRIDLNGDWAIRFSPALRPETDGFEAPDFDDGSWDSLRVPSHWQLRGYGRPVYVNTAYPVPVDPPFVPAPAHARIPGAVVTWRSPRGTERDRAARRAERT
ncbi:hypothetical protein [Streptomyces sp. NPDC048142]|uniref:hypothetical protein n=1 Tax=Streptomyces sp. NPDC048142 TaxID=3365501 RepID=UPI003714C2CC